MTLPKALRNVLGVVNGGTLMYSFKEGDVVLQPAATYPIRIYTDEEIAEFDAQDAALGDVMDKYFEKKGLVYDSDTWTIREKEKPYQARKRKKKV